MDHAPGEGVARKLGRTALWVPRIPLVLMMRAFRGAFYLQDRYNVSQVAEEFQTEDKKIKFFPSAFAETGFGLNVGMRASLTDLISEEQITGRVGIGGRDRFIADLGVARRFGPVAVSITGRREARDNDLFFGYGNTDLITPEMPLDPLTAGVGAQSRFRSRLLRGVATASIKLPQELSLTATSAVVQREFDGTGAADSIDTFYDVNTLPGFLNNTTYLHSELTVAWDTRRRASRWDGHGIRSAGGLVLAFADYQHGLDEEPDFVRYGMDLQRLVKVARGPRLLEFRLYGEAVTGTREEVPFTELPRLGGSNLLRGYVAGRFRDRLAAVGQVRYLWPALSWLAPSIFVDAGRVWASYDELSLKGMRVGFGGGIEVYGRSGLALRAELASSIDGGVTGVVMFEPASSARMEHH